MPWEKLSAVRWLFALVCAYECVAVATGRAPTVSTLCRKRRWVEAGLLAFLLLHLHAAARPWPGHGDG